MDLRQREAEKNKSILEQQTVQSRLKDQLKLRQKAEADLQVQLRQSNREVKELKGVTHAIRKQGKQCGWDPAKMDALIKQTHEAYNIDYHKAKAEVSGCSWTCFGRIPEPVVRESMFPSQLIVHTSMLARSDLVSMVAQSFQWCSKVGQVFPQRFWR